jgi:hypothetical protein
MKNFNYEGVNKQGRVVTGSTSAANEQEVKAQLRKFGFSNVRVQEEEAASGRTMPSRQASGPTTSAAGAKQAAQPAEPPPQDLVQKLVDGDIEIGEPITEEEAERDMWRRAEALARVRKFRRRERIAMIVAVVLAGLVAAYFVYDRITEIPAPQPQIIMRTSSEMLSFKDVYVKGPDLVFVVFSRNWNGNVRVDFQAWDAFNNRIDFGIARLGFIGEHYGGAPEKSGTFKLKKSKFYERIEILVSGDEGK